MNISTSIIKKTVLLLSFLLYALLISTSHIYVYAEPNTVLDDYISTHDPAYNYQHFASVPGESFTAHVFSMTSQQWRTASEVDRTLWSHWLVTIVPDTVTTDTSMLIIDGHSNRDLPRLDSSAILIGGQIAVSSQSIVSIISQVPNQPLAFPDQPEPLREDSLVAYSWDKAMITGDPSWHVYLPMVKSVIRTMDTVQAIAPLVAQKAVNDFAVVGFSKRGAISWLSAVVDPRVKALSPGVIDFLNVAPHFEHHYSSYGFYSPFLQPYLDYNIIRRVRTPEGQGVLKVIDPYSYLDNLDMPKFLLNSSGDQFFPSDSARHYYSELKGENLIRYVPNTGHTLTDSTGSAENAIFSLLSWYLNIIYDVPRPNVSWHKNDAGLTVTAFPPPVAATLWRAHNPVARDFRKGTTSDTWLPEPLVGSGNGIYQVHVNEPDNGWNAYFVEFNYPGVGGLPQTYSTRVFITPDTLPFEVTDPVGKPRGKGFWKVQITKAVTSHGIADVDSETLQTYFPIPIFGQQIKDIDDAYELYTTKSKTIESSALQHCLVVRLNVKHKELGWYSELEINIEDDDEDEENDTLWRIWQNAHDAFLAGEAEIAKDICEEINER